MPQPPVPVELWADPHCPYAYLAAYRLRRLTRGEYEGRVRVVHKSLAIEVDTERPTPKRIVEEEAPVLAAEEADLPYRPWARPESEWPVTSLPALEAVKCAERQDPTLADDLDWAIREGFFSGNVCISMRHVLLALAARVGLDANRFREDFDGGVARADVMRETREGWYGLDMEVSPTLRIPGGQQFRNPGAPTVRLDPARDYQVRDVVRPRDDGSPWDAYRRILDAAIEEARATPPAP